MHSNTGCRNVVNQVGGQTDIIFDGGSTVIGPNELFIGQLELLKRI